MKDSHEGMKTRRKQPMKNLKSFVPSCLRVSTHQENNAPTPALTPKLRLPEFRETSHEATKPRRRQKTTNLESFVPSCLRVRTHQGLSAYEQ